MVIFLKENFLKRRNSFLSRSYVNEQIELCSLFKAPWPYVFNCLLQSSIGNYELNDMRFMQESTWNHTLQPNLQIFNRVCNLTSTRYRLLCPK